MAAESFTALGRGNGFPFCALTSNPSGSLSYLSGLTLSECMQLYWNLRQLTVSADFDLDYDVYNLAGFVESDSITIQFEKTYDVQNSDIVDPEPKSRICPPPPRVGYYQDINFVPNAGIRLHFGFAHQNTLLDANLVKNGPDDYDLRTRPGLSTSAENIWTIYVSIGDGQWGSLSRASDIACLTNNPGDSGISVEGRYEERGDIDYTFTGYGTVSAKIYSRPAWEPGVSRRYLTGWTIRDLSLTPVFWTY